jgi:O-Antigen ligase
MNSVTTRLYSLAAWGVGVVLVLVPFHAFLTVWLGSAFGVYEISRLWKEGLLAGLALVAVWLLWKDAGLRRAVRQNPLFIAIGAYVLLHVLLGLWALVRGQVNAEALAYALTVNLRFVGFFVICCIIASRVGWLRRRWAWLFLIPASVVVLIGLLQAFVLPVDTLKHVGYGPETIAPYQTVDQKLEYVRVQSTLRGANPLGAYLVVVAAGAMAVLARGQYKPRIRLMCGMLLAASLVVLALTYSRSAYIGAAIAMAAIAWWAIARPAVRRWLAAGLAALLVVASGAAILWQDNNALQNIAFHTDETSQSAQTSNEDRWAAQQQAVQEVLHEPLGRGPGTAGPASQHTIQSSRIAENYYLQLGQEVGWLGLGLFGSIIVLVARQLWRIKQTALGAALLASLLGIIFINVVSHAWADDTLGLVWWGFAGIALAAPAILKDRHENRRLSSIAP